MEVKVKAIPSCTAPPLPLDLFLFEPNSWKTMQKATLLCPAGRHCGLSESHCNRGIGWKTRRNFAELLSA